MAPPEHYEGAVARAVERIRAGDFEKIVIAREVAVHAPADHDDAAVLGVLRAAFESCYVFCAGRGDAAFIGASPVRSCWCGASACALPRSRSPARSAAAAELAETEVKLGALLPVLSG